MCHPLVVFIFLSLVCQTWTQLSELDSKKPPHIIIIVADDLGWNDVSVHGSAQIATPNVDALALDGIVLNNYYVMPLCTPSRSALLSGYHPIHTGLQHDTINGMEPYGMPLNLTLLPEHLKRLGYSTHGVGKWHLGFYKKEYTPTFRGFESHFGYWLGHESYYDHTVLVGSSYGLDLRDNMAPVWNREGKYATEIFTERAVEVIRNHNASKPLFLYLSHLAVHAGNGYSPLESPAKYTARFPHITDIKRRLFAGMVSALDDSVGEVVRALGESRMLQDSLVVFTTDNGGAAGGIDNSAGSNWPLRGTKATLWQGGVKGTALVWSQRLGGGGIREQLMHVSDWLPTLYSAAGGLVSDLGPVDGVNMWPTLSKDLPSPRHHVLLNIDPLWNMSALVYGRFKLLMGTYPAKLDYWYGPSGRDAQSEALLPCLPLLTNSSLVAQVLRSIGRNISAPPVVWYSRFNVTCGPRPSNQSDQSCYPTQHPCLFDLDQDPCEYRDLSQILSTTLSLMIRLLADYSATSVPPINKPSDPRANPSNFNFTWTNWDDYP